MRFALAIAFVLVCGEAWAGQPRNIVLNPNGTSYIYPVFDTSDWVLTQPDASRMFLVPDGRRVTHFGDDYFAQDWARECGRTYGSRLYAGISGRVVYAGWRGPYGNTVVIYDDEAKFALKYSHLSEIWAKVGELVLAGKSFIGRVGNTGNIQATGCAINPGTHLHLVLFKNVRDPYARPVTSTLATDNAAPTDFAAPFSYVTEHELAKAPSDSTVYAMYYGTKVPVSAASFESNGYGFDKYGSLFQPLAGKVRPAAELAGIPSSHYFWPLRDGALLKASNLPTVYVSEDGRKEALSGEIFSCRSLRFGEVKEISPSERDRYLPVDDYAALGCVPKVRQALADWASFAAFMGMKRPDLGSYFFYPDWDPSWELRIMNFSMPDGKRVELLHGTSTRDPKERYIGYADPGTGAWSGWQRIN